MASYYTNIRIARRFLDFTHRGDEVLPPRARLGPDGPIDLGPGEALDECMCVLAPAPDHLPHPLRRDVADSGLQQHDAAEGDLVLWVLEKAQVGDDVLICTISASNFRAISLAIASVLPERE